MAARAKAKAALTAAKVVAMPVNAQNHLREKAKARPMIDSAITVGRRDILRRVVPMRPTGNGEGKSGGYGGKGGRVQNWPPQNAIKSLCSFSPAAPKKKIDLEGFQTPVQNYPPTSTCVVVSY